MTRVSFYIDGFNLYHAVAGLGDQRLKWVDLRSLASSYLREGDTLASVVFFTAVNNWDPAKRKRHIAYIDAQSAHGVEVVESNFRTSPKMCHTRGQRCRFKEEKKTDVKIALRMLEDCYQDRTDRLFLVTNDSDQVPTIQSIRGGFPDKRVFVIAPPERHSEGMELVQAAHASFQLTAGRIRQHPLPRDVRDSAGRLIATRPAIYGGA